MEKMGKKAEQWPKKGRANMKLFFKKKYLMYQY